MDRHMYEKRNGGEVVDRTTNQFFGILVNPKMMIVLYLESAREERAKELLSKHWMEEQN